MTDKQQPAEATDDRGNLMTVGQIGMWVFISTEAILFISIIATYLIFRLTSLETGWPRSSIMHASMVAGIINTVILVLSGVTAWNIHKSSREDRPLAARLWLVATLVLGTTFLGIKSWEYHEKYKVGLLPVPGEKQLHESADYEYVAHVNQRLRDYILDLEALDESDSPLTDEQSERLEMLYSLKQNMVEATARNAGRTTSPYHAQLCMNLMAWQIYPHPDTSHNIEEVLEPEMQRLSAAVMANTERLTLVERRQQLVDNQIQELSEDLEQYQLLGTAESNKEEVKEKQDWLEVKQQQKTELDVEAKRIRSTLTPLQGRVGNLVDSFGREDILGINERYDFRLPVVVPGGQAWIGMYLLITGVHALHLIVGLLALLYWLPRKLDSRHASAIYVTCMYWQFVDAVWLVIFWKIYF